MEDNRRARVWQAASEMRRHHPEGHPRHELWKSMAELLDFTAQRWYAQSLDVKHRVNRIAVNYLLATPAPEENKED